MSGQLTAKDKSSSPAGNIKVANWDVDVRALEIRNGAETEKLESKVMDLLVFLSRQPGNVCSRQELEEAIWPDVVVGYDSLTAGIAKLRKAFGDDPRRPSIIKTIPKVGYSLIAEVASLTAEAGEAEQHAVSRTMQSGQAAPANGKASIAVLAFMNLNEDAEQELLSDAMAETIITELSRFSDFLVVARDSSFVYKSHPASARQISAELGVRYIVEGSLQRSADQLRVTAKLVDAPSDIHLWAEHYDRDAEDIFIVQDEITRTIVSTIASTLQVKERARAERTHPANLAAYEYCLRGEKMWWCWTRETNEQALEFFDKALELDPDLARGYVGLARVYLNGFRWSHLDMPRDQSLRRALAVARKAIELDPFDYATHGILACIHMRRGALDEANERFIKALQLNPNAECLLALCAELRQYEGRYEESVELLKLAIQRNPHHPEWYHWVLADTLSIAGRNEEALAAMNKLTTMPNDRAYRTLAFIYVKLDRIKEARAVVEDYLTVVPGFTLGDYEQYLETLPYHDNSVRTDAINALRLAGMPE